MRKYKLSLFSNKKLNTLDMILCITKGFLKLVIARKQESKNYTTSRAIFTD